MALAYKCYFNTYGKSISEELKGFIGKLEKEFVPDRIVVANEGGSLKRSEIFPEYKANRPEKDPEFVSSLKEYFNTFDELKIPVLSTKGYEADDIIGSIANRADRNHIVYIVSNDKDFIQLVNDNVYLLRYDNKFNLIDKNEAASKYGISTNQFVDYLSLVGDNADNIKGAKGIGPKTASKLINEFGDLGNIYNNLGIIKPKISEKLAKSKSDVMLAKELVQIEKNLDLDYESILGFW